MKKRKFSRRFKLLVQKVCVLLFLLFNYILAKLSGEGIGFAFFCIIGIPILFSKELYWEEEK